jgi:serine-type D-Ala-D-Ala carboxypeptidase (penicillin-binding protein 5/6)
MDADSGTILLEKGGTLPAIPASTIKLLTAEVVFDALKRGEISLDQDMIVSEHAWRTGGAPSRGSTMFANLNSRIRVEDLIRGLIIDSANDAAIALAEGLAGSEDAFAVRMNQRAAALGLSDLHATNPWGRDDREQRVTAHSMALLTAHLIRSYPDFYRYYSEKELTWNKIRQLNRNPLLLMDVGADGLLTGSVDENSGYGLIGSAVQNGQRLILIIYGAKTAKERADEARKIFLWGFHAFESHPLFFDGEIIGSVSVYGGASASVNVRAKGPVQLFLQRGQQERVQGKIFYRGPIAAPVREGDQIAHLVLTRAGIQILDIPLYAAQNIETGNLPSRAFDAALELGQGLFYAHVLKRARAQ